MKKLYYENPYINEYKTEIIDIKEKNEKYHVILEETIFFPGGGGQFKDIGFIENQQVVDVYEENGVVYHVVDKKPAKIHKVFCKIDWEHRFCGMQQHLAQHVLSGCFFTLFNKNTFGFHLGKSVSTVDIEGPLTQEDIRKAEKLANDIIFKNLKVNCFFPSKQELKKLKLRRALPKTNEKIRVVEIDDLDINACCGVHPLQTIELQMIKIKGFEKHKQGYRIEFLAGKRAIDDSFKNNDFIKDVCSYLKSGEQDVINSIKKLSQNFKELTNENKRLVDEIGEFKVREMLDNSYKIDGVTIVKNIESDIEVKKASAIVKKLVANEKVIVLYAVKTDERVNMIFASSKDIKNINMGEVLKDSISLVDGKGGGSKTLAQGAGKNNGNLEATLDYAVRKIEKFI
ncbi:alanyl-tRNA editing protein [Sarcina ventriculi]|uniref:alanyl-tRNA editing protein n=1 Tax=Sarcina ventriculi TaxID=1267 RepID=UPI001C0F3BB3|nr:DHHA1 domain-containing protein [Sarcina ventriculi]MBU5321555.1 alanyl-tRNA editing protein AlaX-L [Sarcina ventriculi]